MSDFTSEDLFEAVDRAVNELLDRGFVTGPPIDTLSLLRDEFGVRVDYDEPHDAPKYGDRPRRRQGPNELLLHPDSTPESQATLAGRAIAKKIIPVVLSKLGVVPGTENKGAQASLVGLVSARILLPTRWFVADARRAAFDLIELKERYSSANWEMLAWRMLDADDEPSVVAILDDGAVSARRGNRFSVNKSLTAAEQACVVLVQETDDPARVRKDDWSAAAWPTQGIPFRRIIVRAVPDEI